MTMWALVLSVFVVTTTLGIREVRGQFGDSTALFSSGMQVVHKWAPVLPNRAVIIYLWNGMKSDSLTGGRFWLYSGQSFTPPRTVVTPSSAEYCIFTKTAHRARGSVGVMTYRVGDIGRFAVTWSVPYDRTWAANWFHVRWLSDDTEFSASLYDEAYNDCIWKSDLDAADLVQDRCGRYASKTGCDIAKDGVVVKVTMSVDAHALLTVNVQDVDWRRREAARKNATQSQSI